MDDLTGALTLIREFGAIGVLALWVWHNEKVMLPVLRRLERLLADLGYNGENEKEKVTAVRSRLRRVRFAGERPPTESPPPVG